MKKKISLADYLRLELKQDTMITLNFKGYIPAEDLDEIKKVRGIYAAFTYKETKEGKEGRLVYIGMADQDNTVHNRIKSHIDGTNEAPSGKQSVWEQRYCSGDVEIRYAYAAYQEHLEDIEAALIFKNQPLANIHHKDDYGDHMRPISIECKGDIGTLLESIEIKQENEQ